jgi:phosphoserine phosphatase RsbU/P
MLKNRGLAFKLTLLILASISLIFVGVFAYNYVYTKRIIVQNIEKNAVNLARATVNRIDKVLASVEKAPENLSCFMAAASYSGGDLIELLQAMARQNTEIYGSAIAFAPFEYSRNIERFAPYVYKSFGKVEFIYIPYDYFYWDWYQIPKELNHAVWSEPYFDEGAGNIIMSTYSVPFYRTRAGERIFSGVVTADISLSWLQQMVSAIQIAKTGYGFLITKNGTFITHPSEPLIMNETIFSVAEARNDPHLRELGRSMIQGESGFVPMKNLDGRACWMAYAPLPSNGWSLGVLYPQDELMADITRLNRTVLVLSFVGFLLLLLVIVLIARSITRPLRLLSGATDEIATGNLDVEIPAIRGRDEVARLAESFGYMKGSLKQYIQELTETTAAKERIESELKIAHDIQMGILHKIFPPFPDRHEFDIYATILPAKEVGGDLYDFFFMDEDHLCFTVGDVSGKGVPASLFMAITNTLIKTKATRGLSPEDVLSRVNEDLSMDNPSMMFVTLFLGILNIRTGELRYANGGHNPPFLLRATGEVTPLEMTGDVALGVVEKFEFHSRQLTLQPGDSVFLYTDGVTEAMNAQDELFGEARLVSVLKRLREAPMRGLIQGVMKAIQAFSQGLAQSDDITMLRLIYKGAPKEET